MCVLISIIKSVYVHIYTHVSNIYGFLMRIPKLCLSVCPYPEKRNHHSFVNISPTLVIDTSTERSSRKKKSP